MKKFILVGILTGFILFVNGNAYAQQSGYAHWSAEVKAGANRGQYGKILSMEGFGGTFGVGIERAFNPLWGLGVDYTYLSYPYAGIKGSVQEFTGMANINLSNLVAKYRTGGWQQVNTYFHIGGGLAFYSAQTSGKTLVIPIGASIEYNISSLLSLSLIGDRRWHSSPSMGNVELQKVADPRVVMWTASVGLRFKFGIEEHVRNVNLVKYEYYSH
jgi:hypothetical protein